jgi:phosphatidylinositol-3-phosphatase
MCVSFSSKRSVLILLFLLVLAELGCGGGSRVTQNNSQPPTTPPSASAPAINLSAQPSTVTSGASSVLNWTTARATWVTINGLGTFAATGSVTVVPSATTTYTAVANGPGGTSNATVTVSVTPSPPPPPPSAVPVFSHVFVVVEENHSYSSVIGSSAMPYLNSLASRYGLATQYYGDVHPSIGNYFMMATGQLINTNDAFTGTTSADSIVRQLMTAGKTWKCYAENLPNVGYTGGDVLPYVKHHNPFAYMTDVINSSTQVNNLVPFGQFAPDMNNNALPQFSFLVPNLQDDAHDGTLNQADTWLKQNIAPLIASSVFQNSLVIIVFDEGDATDTAHGGGHIAAVIVSPKAKPGYTSTTLYQHESLLRLVLEASGVSSFPGNAASAPDMLEFFQ